MDNYLIPANTKRGKLIFGLFRPIDLGIFLSGVGFTFILFLLVPMNKTWVALLCVAPGLICSLLVFPMPNYHNVLTALMEMYEFFTQRQKFIWRGWCFTYDESKKK